MAGGKKSAEQDPRTHCFRRRTRPRPLIPLRLWQRVCADFLRGDAILVVDGQGELSIFGRDRAIPPSPPGHRPDSGRLRLHWGFGLPFPFGVFLWGQGWRGPNTQVVVLHGPGKASFGIFNAPWTSKPTPCAQHFASRGGIRNNGGAGTAKRGRGRAASPKTARAQPRPQNDTDKLAQGNGHGAPNGEFVEAAHTTFARALAERPSLRLLGQGPSVGPTSSPDRDKRGRAGPRTRALLGSTPRRPRRRGGGMPKALFEGIRVLGLTQYEARGRAEPDGSRGSAAA